VKSKQERKNDNASIYKIKLAPFQHIDVTIYEEKERISLMGDLQINYKALQQNQYSFTDDELTPAQRTKAKLEQLAYTIQRKLLFDARKPYLALLQGCNNNAVDCDFHYLLNDLICREISSFIVCQLTCK
jgi:hypothetical protein